MTTENPNADQHTPEPWAYTYGAVYQSDPQGSDSGLGPRIALADRECPETTPAERDANLRRAAACVNACAGIPTAALEAGAVADLARTLADLLEEIPRHIGKRDVRKHYSLLVAERYAGDAIRKLKVPEPATD